MTRKQLLRSPEYWTTQFQIQIYQEVSDYWHKEGRSCEKVAKKLGISKYKLLQILNGEWVGSIKEFVSILLIMKRVPVIDIQELKNQK